MNSPRTLNAAFASSFAALTAIGGMISVPLPFSPVPIVAGAFILGKLVVSRRKIGLRWMLASMVLCTFVICGLGVSQLSLWMGVGLEKAAAIGVLPFLI